MYVYTAQFLHEARQLWLLRGVSFTLQLIHQSFNCFKKYACTSPLSNLNSLQKWGTFLYNPCNPCIMYATIFTAMYMDG